MDVKKATHRTTYSEPKVPSADTPEALIALLDPGHLAEFHKDVHADVVTEYLVVNRVHFFAVAAAADRLAALAAVPAVPPQPQSAPKKKGGKASKAPAAAAASESSSAAGPVDAAPAPVDYEMPFVLYTDLVQNGLDALYEDVTASHFVKHFPGFFDTFCKRLYGIVPEGKTLDHPLLDAIKAFKLSFQNGKVMVYIYLDFDESTDRNLKIRMSLDSQISSMFPYFNAALNEQTVRGWNSIAEKLAQMGHDDIMSMLPSEKAESFPVVTVQPDHNGPKSSKKKNGKKVESPVPVTTIGELARKQRIADELIAAEETEQKNKIAKEALKKSGASTGKAANSAIKSKEAQEKDRKKEAQRLLDQERELKRESDRQAELEQQREIKERQEEFLRQEEINRQAEIERQEKEKQRLAEIETRRLQEKASKERQAKLRSDEANAKRLEAERQKVEEAERKKVEEAERKRAEAERQKLKAEQARSERARLEQARLEKARLEQARLARIEQERQQSELAEQQRQRQQLEQERQQSEPALQPQKVVSAEDNRVAELEARALASEALARNLLQQLESLQAQKESATASPASSRSGGSAEFISPAASVSSLPGFSPTLSGIPRSDYYGHGPSDVPAYSGADAGKWSPQMAEAEQARHAQAQQARQAYYPSMAVETVFPGASSVGYGQHSAHWQQSPPAAAHSFYSPGSNHGQGSFGSSSPLMTQQYSSPQATYSSPFDLGFPSLNIATSPVKIQQPQQRQSPSQNPSPLFPSAASFPGLFSSPSSKPSEPHNKYSWRCCS